MSTPSDEHPSGKPDCCPKQHDKKWIDRVRLFFEFVALLGLLYYAHQAGIQAVATREAADAAKTGAYAATSQLELSQRPWVTISTATSNEVTYDADGIGSMKMLFSLSNIGNSPAVIALAFAEAYRVGPGEDKLKNPWIAQQALCASLANRGPNTGGYTIFPNETVQQAPVLITIKPLAGSFAVIVGCVDYKFAFAEGHHHTGFVFNLLPPQGEGRSITRKVSVERGFASPDSVN